MFRYALQLIIILASIQLGYGLDCKPSGLESEYTEVIQKVAKVSIWGSFPADTTMSIKDKSTSNGSGFFIITDPKEKAGIINSGLASACDDNPLLFKMKTIPKVREGYWPGCSSVENEDACVPPLKDYNEKFKKNVGMEIIEKDKLSKVYQDFGFKYQLTDIQAAITNSVHESFHGYQENREDFYDSINELSASYDECLNSPKWSEQFQKERKWWQSTLDEIYDCRTSHERLITIAKEFISHIRPSPGVHSECNRALEKSELIEGTAQFAGNLALLLSDKITAQDFSNYEKQFFDVSPKKHSYGYIYASGGSISMLLERLKIPQWRQKIEKGQTQSSILRDYLNNDGNKSCVAETDSVSSIAQFVQKLESGYCSKAK